MPIRRTITFIGTVQGVGFRASTRSVATDFDVAGYVRNQRDGSVLCIVEGEAEELDRFVAAVQRTMSGCVRETIIQHSPATREFAGFDIRH